MYEQVKNCGAGKFVSRGVWRHPDRIINSNEILLIIEGQVYINEDGQEYCLKPNDCLVLTAGRRHFGYAQSENVAFYWVHWTGGPDIDKSKKIQRSLNSDNLALLFRQLMHYRAEGRGEESLHYLTRLILIELFSQDEGKTQNNLTANIAAWIYANRDIPQKTGDIAAHFGYDGDYISRLFKKTYGKTLKAYIDGQKMQYIRQLLLATDQSLQQIAHNAGFSEYKYFLKFFTYHEGISPSNYRKAYPNVHMNSK